MPGHFFHLEILVTMFIVTRFILGLGIVFAIVAASSLMVCCNSFDFLVRVGQTLHEELSHPKERATMGSLFNVGYMVGKSTS